MDYDPLGIFSSGSNQDYDPLGLFKETKKKDYDPLGLFQHEQPKEYQPPSGLYTSPEGKKYGNYEQYLQEKRGAAMIQKPGGEWARDYTKPLPEQKTWQTPEERKEVQRAQAVNMINRATETPIEKGFNTAVSGLAEAGSGVLKAVDYLGRKTMPQYDMELILKYMKSKEEGKSPEDIAKTLASHKNIWQKGAENLQQYSDEMEKEGIEPGIIQKVVKAVGRLPIDLPKYAATGFVLPFMVEGAQQAEEQAKAEGKENTIPDEVLGGLKGMVKGYIFGKLQGFGGLAPKGLKHISSGALQGASTAGEIYLETGKNPFEGENFQDVVSQTVLGTALPPSGARSVKDILRPEINLFNKTTGKSQEVPTGTKLNYPEEIGQPDKVIVYHGTPHEFEGNSFDLNKVKTGEGYNSEGEGIYVTDSIDTANKFKTSEKGSIVKSELNPDANIVEYQEPLKTNDQFDGLSPQEIRIILKKDNYSEKEIVDYFKNIGVDGWEVKESRVGGDSDNYYFVVFDPKNLNILEVNGKSIKNLSPLKEESKIIPAGLENIKPDIVSGYAKDYNGNFITSKDQVIAMATSPDGLPVYRDGEEFSVPFKNPLVLTSDEAAQIKEYYNTLDQTKPENAMRLTDHLMTGKFDGEKHDGLIMLAPNPKGVDVIPSYEVVDYKVFGGDPAKINKKPDSRSDAGDGGPGKYFSSDRRISEFYGIKNELYQKLKRQPTTDEIDALYEEKQKLKQPERFEQIPVNIPPKSTAPEVKPVGPKIEFKPDSLFKRNWNNVMQDAEKVSAILRENKIDPGSVDAKSILRVRGGVGSKVEATLNYGPSRLNEKTGNIENMVSESEAILPTIHNAAKQMQSFKSERAREDFVLKYQEMNRIKNDLAVHRFTEGPLKGKLKATQKQIQEANDFFKQVERLPESDRVVLEQTKNNFQKNFRSFMDMMVESGIYSRAEANKIQSVNKNFFPLKTTIDSWENDFIMEKPGVRPVGKLDRFKRGDADLATPMNSLIDYTTSVTSKYYKQLTANALVRNLKQFNNKDVIKRVGHSGENIIDVKENGETVHYQVDPHVYYGYRKLTPEIVNSKPFAEFIKTTTSMIKNMITYNPKFSALQVVKDSQQAWVMGSRLIPILSPLHATIQIVKGRMGLGGSKNYDTYKEMIGSFAGMNTIAEYGTRNRKAMIEKMMATNLVDNVKAHLLHPVDTLANFGKMLDIGTRVATITKLKGEATSLQKANIAREISLNFPISGEKARKVNEYIAFFNPAIRSLERVGRAAKENPVGFSVRTFAAVTLPEIILYGVNNFMLSDEQKKVYGQLGNDVKDRFHIFFIPGTDNFMTIPKIPLLGDWAGNTVRKTLEATIGKDASAFNGIFGDLFKSVSPVRGQTAVEVLPTVFLPIAELIFDFNSFFGGKITPAGKENLPSELKYGSTTSEVAKRLGALIGASPAKIEHFVKKYFTRTGKDILNLADALLFDAANGKKPTDILEGFPFTGRNKRTSDKDVTLFYDSANRMIDKYNEGKGYYDIGKKENDQSKKDYAKLLLKEDPKLKNRVEILTEIKKRMTKINIDIQKIIKDEKLSDDQKEKKITILEDEKLELAKMSLDKYIPNKYKTAVFEEFPVFSIAKQIFK